MIYYKEGYKYQLNRDCTVQTNILNHNIQAHYYTLFPTGELLIKKSFCWNGASLWIDTKNNFRAALVHDALCDAINEGYLPREYQKPADKLFQEICEQDGTGSFLNWLQIRGVRWFSQSRFKKFKPKPVLIHK